MKERKYDSQERFSKSTAEDKLKIALKNHRETKRDNKN